MNVQGRTAIVAMGMILATGPGVRGQNLLPNASFEDFDGDCTYGLNYWDLSDWAYPTCSAPPLCFNSCWNLLVPWGGVPDNEYGHQAAHTGQGYCALQPFNSMAPLGNPKSYASIDLTAPLIAGQEYCLRFWLSLADVSTYKTGTLHAFLWYGLPSACTGNDSIWDTNAAATFDISVVDTASWHLLETSFTASGGESNLTLGSFLFGAELDTVHIGFDPFENFALYFIDDVYVGSCDVGIGEQSAGTITSVFPNPVQQGSRVVVGLDASDTDRDVQVIDATGRVVVVLKASAGTDHLELTTDDLTRGLYLITGGDSLKSAVRLVVE